MVKLLTICFKNIDFTLSYKLANKIDVDEAYIC